MAQAKMMLKAKANPLIRSASYRKTGECIGAHSPS